MKTWQLSLTSLAVSLLFNCLVLAQTKPAATVQAFGDQSLELKPEKVRLLLVAKAEGANAKEAVERLNKHQEVVRNELLAMKAEVNSIKITSADMRHHILGVPDQYQNMNAKFFTNLLEGSLNLRIEDLPTVHTASCVIQADWTLPEADANVMLQLPNSLRREVEQRDLVGEDNGLELSPEQAASISKFKAAMDEHMGFLDDSTGQRPPVQVLFVTRVQPAARMAALKAAYEKAREECELLAAASGHQLGRLVNLSKAAPEESSSSLSYSSLLDSHDALSARLAKTTTRDEISSAQADGLEARFQVRAVFELE